jgi:hypothetical protein
MKRLGARAVTPFEVSIRRLPGDPGAGRQPRAGGGVTGALKRSDRRISAEVKVASGRPATLRTTSITARLGLDPSFFGPSRRVSPPSPMVSALIRLRSITAQAVARTRMSSSHGYVDCRLAAAHFAFASRGILMPFTSTFRPATLLGLTLAAVLAAGCQSTSPSPSSTSATGAARSSTSTGMGAAGAAGTGTTSGPGTTTESGTKGGSAPADGSSSSGPSSSGTSGGSGSTGSPAR